MNWILASASPRRRDILSHLGLPFTVRVADVDEQSDEPNGAALVELLARRKALAVAHTLTEQEKREGTVVLAADTVVLDPDGHILGKPRDAEDARRMLRTLSGRTHSVVSGVAVWRDDTLVSAHEVTTVTFSPLDEQTVARYVASGEPLDKAGAYGIQDTAALWVSGICGDYFNVVGLPVHRLEQLLREHFDLSLWTE